MADKKKGGTGARAAAGAGTVSREVRDANARALAPSNQQPVNVSRGGEPGVETEDQRIPIGVPRGYGAPTPVNPFLGQYGFPTPPQYYNGDDWTPNTYAPEVRIQMQRDLVNAGLLDEPYQTGVWDDKTRAAYRDALSLANASGKNYGQIISDLKANVAQYGKAAESKTRQPLFVTLTNPSDIANVGQQIATRTIGRRLSDDELTTLTSAYSQMEREFQQQRYAAMGSGLEGGPGGEQFSPPDLSSFLEERSKQIDPEGASEITGLHNLDAFNELLSSSRSRLSSVVNPVR